MSRSLQTDFLTKVAPSPEERMVVLACSDAQECVAEVLGLYAGIQDDTCWDITQEHELSGRLAHILLNADGARHERWQQAHAEIAHRIGAYLAEVDRIAQELSKQNIRLVALKNAGIARGIFQCAGCSPMGDVDLLVRRSDFVAVHDFLLNEGYTCDSRNPTEAGSLEEGKLTGGTEYHKELSGVGTFWLELQWRPVSGRWLRPDQEPSGNDLVDRSISIPGTAVRLLSPEDNLLQVCLHTAKHSYLRAPGLRLHTDVERIVRNVSIDWEVFVSRAKSLKVQTAVYFSLWIPAQLLRAPVPEAVLASLAPSRGRRNAISKLLLDAGLLHPKKRKFTNAAYIRFNALLYDSSGDLLRAIFPDYRWMKQRYEFRSPLLLPYYHLRRIVDLGARRVGI